MKQLSKMMLAAVASVALATSAYAWDFSASGSSTATFKQKTVTPATGDATVDTNFTSSGGGVTLSSSNSDGANSATFSYTADWNGDAGNFDESVSVSGSKKVGNWTASSATTQHMQKDVGPTDSAKPMRANNSAVITLTDGSMTYKLGNAAHLSTAEKAVNGPMGGAQDAEARLDAFDGFSVGLGVGPGTLTVALEMRSGTTAVFFGEDLDSAAVSNGFDGLMACGADATNFGINFAGDVGADLTFTYASGSSSAQADSCTGDNSSNTVSHNTMGLGVAVPVGGMSIGLDYESTSSAATTTGGDGKIDKSGFELSVTMPLGDATAGVNVSSTSTTETENGTAADPATTAGTELWYTVPIGAVSLSAGYGSAAVKDGATTTEIGAEMTMSF